jgi:hypothetical protein
MNVRRGLTRLTGIACAAALLLPATQAHATLIHQGAGFNADDAGLLSTYTIHLVDSTDIEDFRAEAESVAAELESITGLTVTVASGVVTSATAAQGEITIATNTDSSCSLQSPTWLGCTGHRTAFSGGPRNDVEYEQGGQVTLNVALAALSSHVQQHVIAHEVGHALGLAHYDLMFEGHYQIMRSSADALGGDELNYQSGDINGLLWELARGTP